MNKDNYTFSSEYLRKKSALYQGLKRYEGYYGRRINHVPLRLAVAFAVCLILAASVMAASEFSFFSILKKDGKTVISVGSSQTGEAEPPQFEKHKVFLYKGINGKQWCCRYYNQSIL